MSISERIAELALTLPIPEHVVEKSKECLLDWTGCVAAAQNLPLSSMMRSFAMEQGGVPESGIAGTKTLFPATVAALVNGTMAHTAEFDDIYKDAIYHPGAPVIASALAMAQRVKATGSELLRGIILGYEVSNRLGEAVNPSHYKYFHTTGTVGTIGAAVAAAVIAKLPKDKFVSALGLAGTAAAGVWESNGTMAKPYHAGKAAMNGILAVLLAEKGVTGAVNILEGEKGFLHAMSSQHDEALEKAFGDLGQRYTILEMTFKYYGSCGHTHAVIDAVLEGIHEYHIKAEEIERIVVKTYQTAIEVAGIKKPSDPYQAKFSIPYCAAAAAVFGKVRKAEFEPEAFGNQELWRLISLTELEERNDFSERFPNQRGAAVEITTDSGSFAVQKNCRKGDPDNPLTINELEEKFVELSVPYIGLERADYLKEAIRKMDKSTHTNWLIEALVVAGA